MAIRVECDNCKHILRDSAEESGAEPEPSAVLQLSFDGKNLFHMDLCPKCARRYLKQLKGFQETEI